MYTSYCSVLYYSLIWRSFDLPPSVIAKPLPVAKSANSNVIFTTEGTTARKRKRKPVEDDDTPKAFARLMSFWNGKRLPKGPDDGLIPAKGQKRSKVKRVKIQKEQVTEPQNARPELPTIRPGERMSDFAARVDLALPLNGLVNKTTKGGKDPLGLKVARTRIEKKMHRMYNEWREQDRRIKEKRQEALEIAQEDDDEKWGVKWKVDREATGRDGKKAKKGGKRKIIGEADIGDDDGDPWAIVKSARNEGPRKLNDVAQAPPQFSKVPKEKLKASGVSVNIEDIPKASGSLRRRAELVGVRKGVVEGYRQMMKENKALPRQ